MNESHSYKKTIFWRGLVIVLVPLILGTVITLKLNQLWQEAEKIAKEENWQNSYLQQFNHMMGLFEWGLGGAVAGAMVKERNVENAKASLQPVMRTEFAKLKYEARLHPSKFRSITQFEAVALKEADLLTHVPDLGAGWGNIKVEVLTQLPKFAVKMTQYNTEMRRILQSEYEDLKRLRRKQDLLARDFAISIAVMTLAELLVAGVLVLSFSKSFSQRLEKLARKASELSDSKRIETSLRGNDELAYLDHVLSSTSDMLEQAAEHRKSILSMVAHDMRSPLMASQATIELIEQSTPGLSESAKAVLQETRTELGSILQYVNSLLEVQRGREGHQLEKVSEKSSFYEVIDGSARKKNFLIEMRNFVTQPRIFQKSLLLVMLPLLMQSVLMVYICSQVTGIQQVIKQERLYSDLNILNNFQRIDMVRFTGLVLLYLFTNSEKADDKANHVLGELSKSADLAMRLAAKDPDWSSIVIATRNYRERQIKDFRELRPSDSPEKVQQVMFTSGELREGLPESMKARRDANKLGARFTIEIKEAEERFVQSRLELERVFIYSLLGNFALAVFLLLVFNRNISGRLGLLIENASCLGRRKAMSNRILGYDELAYLGLILFKSQQQLDKASDQRSEMMGSLASEMREPLLVSRELINKFEAEAGSLAASTQKQLDRAAKNVERVIGLIDDLLSMETLETGKVSIVKAKTNLRNLAETALAAVSSLSRKKNIELLNLCDSEFMINVDSDRIVQVLVNLLGNALKFSPDNTRIRISSEVDREYVKILVSDEGPGMNPETRAQVFEKYFQAQTPEKKQGFGLGLAICQLIIQSHSGQLGVESEEGKGSTFWFSLPIYSE